MVISIYYVEHPPPHFHVRYGSDHAKIEINSLRIVEGQLGPRPLGLVVEWAARHRMELLENWRLAERGSPLKRIPPLE